MLGRPVAIKVIKPDLVTSSEIVKRFQREARAATQLAHANIVDVYDLGQAEDGTLYIAMELIEGSSLKEIIRTGGPLEPQRIAQIIRQVASALSLAHRNGIVHRDLKPHNIMLTRDLEGREVAKLLDFGIAKTFDDGSTQLTATGFALGTPQYMAPEQATGAAVDRRSDIYALGVILYEMLIGEVPFNDPSTPALLIKHMTEVPAAPSLRRPDIRVDPSLEAIALRCLEKDPDRRFATADDLNAALPGIGTPTTDDSDATSTAAPAIAAVSAGLPPAIAAPPGIAHQSGIGNSAAPAPLVSAPSPFSEAVPAQPSPAGAIQGSAGPLQQGTHPTIPAGPGQLPVTREIPAVTRRPGAGGRRARDSARGRSLLGSCAVPAQPRPCPWTARCNRRSTRDNSGHGNEPRCRPAPGRKRIDIDTRAARGSESEGGSCPGRIGRRSLEWDDGDECGARDDRCRRPSSVDDRRGRRRLARVADGQHPGRPNQHSFRRRGPRRSCLCPPGHDATRTCAGRCRFGHGTNTGAFCASRSVRAVPVRGTGRSVRRIALRTGAALRTAGHADWPQPRNDRRPDRCRG